MRTGISTKRRSASRPPWLRASANPRRGFVDPQNVGPIGLHSEDAYLATQPSGGRIHAHDLQPAEDLEVRGHRRLDEGRLAAQVDEGKAAPEGRLGRLEPDLKGAHGPLDGHRRAQEVLHQALIDDHQDLLEVHERAAFRILHEGLERLVLLGQDGLFDRRRRMGLPRLPAVGQERRRRQPSPGASNARRRGRLPHSRNENEQDAGHAPATGREDARVRPLAGPGSGASHSGNVERAPYDAGETGVPWLRLPVAVQAARGRTSACRTGQGGRDCR